MGSRPPSDDRLLAEQAAYYRARAGEYDEWFFRRGRYDHGAADNQRWFTEVGHLRRALQAFLRDRAACKGGPLRVLELACGTGLWTRELAAGSSGGWVGHVTALDNAPEMLARAADRLAGQPASAPVEFKQADLFAADSLVAGADEFDVAFIGFFLSHVPAAQWSELWRKIAIWLGPSAAVFLVDSLSTATSRAVDHPVPDALGETALRRLNDGREFRVVKVFYSPQSLADRLAREGWDAQIRTTTEYFLYGTASRSPSSRRDQANSPTKEISTSRA